MSIKRLLRFLVDPTVIGYVLSIVFGVGVYFVKQEIRDSVAITLLGSILTTLILLRVEISKNQDGLIEALGINKRLIKDENLRASLYKLTNDYIEITSNLQEPLFVEEAKITIDECVHKIGELAKGILKLKNEQRRLGYIFSKTEDPNVMLIKAVTWLAKGEKNWWQKSHGKKYLELQKEAIHDRGAKITRIFITSNQPKADLKSIITDQKDIGIRVMVVKEKNVSDELLDNFLICDDKWYTKSEFDRRGKSSGGLVSINEIDMSQVKQQWDRLFRQAKEILDVDKDID